MAPSLSAGLSRALPCPAFWEEEPTFDLKCEKSHWALLLLLKEVMSASPFEGGLAGILLGTVSSVRVFSCTLRAGYGDW